MAVEDRCRLVLFPGKIVRLVFGGHVLVVHDGRDGEELAGEGWLEVVVAGEVGKGGGGSGDDKAETWVGAVQGR